LLNVRRPDRPACCEIFREGYRVRNSINILASWIAAVASLAASGEALACSSCGCTLNSDWSSQGYTVSKGFSMDLRYDYYSQTQLRSGTGTVDRGSIALPSEEEVQQSTLNRTVLIGLDYSPSRTWGVNVQIPYIDRPHSTIAEGDIDVSTSHTRGLGDIRVLARYQGFSPDLSWGVQFGLKIPTGRIDDVFHTGPQAGELLDRGLQNGTGTTDLLFGVYNSGNLSGPFGYFAHALVQAPLNARDGFKPGTGVTVSLGVRYRAKSGAFTPQLQLNFHTEQRESGPEADVDNSGATLAYVSPGVSFRLVQKLDGFAFAQLPIYQRVNGLQIEPRMLATVGFRYKF
jgi:hypothetical protein